MNTEDFHGRSAGILLHPTSLPSGRLDDDVDRWLDFLAETGISVWQMLPLGEPQIDLSPYQCISALAMNPALAPEKESDHLTLDGYKTFCDQHADWLFDYSLFKVLKQKFAGSAWYEWPDEWRHRQPHVLDSAFGVYEEEIATYNWQQYRLHDRWTEIKNKANALGIRLFGDIPLFVAHDSADVWANPDRFLLDEDGQPTVVAGVPPDYYSETGQRWGNPHFNWEVMQRQGFKWWLNRIRHHLEQFDILRIDHFRGLESCWVIDAACETAIDGHWQEVPGDELLSTIKREVGHLPIVAEDLGLITEAVTALRKKHQLPGMAVLQFGFDEHADNPHKIANITDDRIVYTGTHDNDTTEGWYFSLDESTKTYVLSDLSIEQQDESADLVVDRLIEAAFASPANLCIVPLQDFLHLGTAARMNTPGTQSGNWTWSFHWEQITDSLQSSLQSLVSRNQRKSP